jgi:FkbM family methyltransferase
MTAGTMVNAVIHRLGFQLRRYPAASEFEADVMRFIREQGVNCVIDVGAHWGEFGLKLRRLRYRGRIVSFEPLTAAFQKLAEAAAGDGAWVIRQEAVAESSGPVTINVTSDTACASVLAPSKFGTERAPHLLSIVGTESAPAIRLSSVWGECISGIREPRVLLKTDTQGLDLEVVRSAGERVYETAGILMEVTIAPLYEGAPHLFSVLPAIESLGFYLAAIAPLNRGRDDRIVELDCLLRRELRI